MRRSIGIICSGQRRNKLRANLRQRLPRIGPHITRRRCGPISPRNRCPAGTNVRIGARVFQWIGRYR